MTTMLDKLAELAVRAQDFVDGHLYPTHEKVKPRIEFVCGDLSDFFSIHAQLMFAFVEHQHGMGIRPAKAPVARAVSGETVEVEVCGVTVWLTCTQKIATPTHGDVGAVEALNMPFARYRATVPGADHV